MVNRVGLCADVNFHSRRNFTHKNKRSKIGNNYCINISFRNFRNIILKWLNITVVRKTVQRKINFHAVFVGKFHTLFKLVKCKVFCRSP